jgi:predicted homoserine dehydrogenase-like protein
VAIANRTPSKAVDAWAVAGRPDAVETDTLDALEDAIRAGRPVVTSDATLLCHSGQIDVILELTGAITYGAEVALAAFAGGKHFVTMNAELDATAGPIMRKKAAEAGVIYTVGDGDQPAVQMNLYRFVQTHGPATAGLRQHQGDAGPLPHARDPEGLRRAMGPDAGDGHELRRRHQDLLRTGHRGQRHGHVRGRTRHVGARVPGQIDGLVDFYDVDRLKALGGVVDYALGATPSPGVYVFAAHDDPRHHIYLDYAKLGKGPLYSFYTPYHLYHFEVPISIARVALFGDTVLATDGPIRVEVVATAKRDLKAGQVIDGLGGFMTYGECENVWVSGPEDLLPMGVAEGCRLVRDVPKDTAIRRADVTLPEGRLIDGSGRSRTPPSPHRPPEHPR